jgi:hypothetical protein
MPKMYRTPDDRAEQRQLRRELRVPLSPAVERRAAENGRCLERIAGGTIQVDLPHGDPISSRPGLPGDKMRRATDAETHRMGVWFRVFIRLDSRRADFLSQVSTRLREHIAELVAIADRIDAAAKRRRKNSHPSRKSA